MSKPTVNLILSLPSELTCEILSIWLHVPSLVCLDSAFCAHCQRQILLALYERPELVCSLAYCPRKNIHWLIERRIRLRDFDVQAEVPTDVLVAYLSEFGRYIRSVQFADEPKYSPLISAVAMNSPFIEAVEINTMKDASFRALQSFPNLNRLNVTRTFFTSNSESDHFSMKLTNVRKLRIAVAESNVPFIEACPRLTHFSLQTYFFQNKESTKPKVWLLKDLTALCLSMDDATVAMVAQHSPSIVHIALHRCDEMTDAGVYTITTQLKLKSIALPCAYRITNKGLKHLHHCASTLQTLHIAQRVGYIDYVVKLRMPAIRTLLSKTHNCQYSWYASVLRFDQRIALSTNATAIMVATTLTDSDLRDVALHCKQVQHLNIHLASVNDRCNFTSTGLFCVIDSCPELKSISVSDKFDKVLFADVLTTHSKLFTSSVNMGTYDVMDM